jgi:uncharacterized damage-inducible protein DinB
MSIDDLLDAWRVNNAVNLELLALCADDDMELKPGKGKSIRSNFTHIVSVRKMWSEAEAIPKLDWKTATREEIVEGFNTSNEAMLELFRRKEAKPGKWSTLGFFAYCVAHEAHHRSQIEIALRINDREPEDKLLYELWEWQKK